jgi:hypothetical protein
MTHGPPEGSRSECPARYAIAPWGHGGGHPALGGPQIDLACATVAPAGRRRVAEGPYTSESRAGRALRRGAGHLPCCERPLGRARSESQGGMLIPKW